MVGPSTFLESRSWGGHDWKIDLLLFKAFLVCKAFDIKVINQGLIIGGKAWFNSVLNIAKEKINMQGKLVVI